MVMQRLLVAGWFRDRIVSFNLMQSPDFMNEVVIQTESLRLLLQSTEEILARILVWRWELQRGAA